ncbi:MAG: hypothetical protein ACE366_14780 [Bradymonadia bacterium]
MTPYIKVIVFALVPTFANLVMGLPWNAPATDGPMWWHFIRQVVTVGICGYTVMMLSLAALSARLPDDRPRDPKQPLRVAIMIALLIFAAWSWYPA